MKYTISIIGFLIVGIIFSIIFKSILVGIAGFVFGLGIYAIVGAIENSLKDDLE